MYVMPIASEPIHATREKKKQRINRKNYKYDWFTKYRDIIISCMYRRQQERLSHRAQI